MENCIVYQTVDGEIHKINYNSWTEQIGLKHRQIKKIVNITGLCELKKLDLQYNRIGQIDGINGLSNLHHLDLANNQINRIEGLDGLSSLAILDLSGNLIERIEGLDNLNNLKILSLSRNRIERIERMDGLTSLHTLFLYNNRIEKIDVVDRLTNLRRLYLYYNPIKDVPLTIMNFRNLTFLDVECQINPIVKRFLTKNKIRTDTTVYDDAQNVHDSQINQQIRCSLFRLMETQHNMTEPQTLEEILIDPILTNQVKQQIVEYSKNPDVHSTLNITFMEALQTVWQIIQSHEYSDCIKKILDQEMQDSICMCFTGRLSRLVNSLNGFDDRVKIQISDQQEIANLIIMIRRKTDNLEQQTLMVRKELTERGYDEQIIAEWLGYLE
jgi:hypothetical protein